MNPTATTVVSNQQVLDKCSLGQSSPTYLTYANSTASNQSILANSVDTNVTTPTTTTTTVVSTNVQSNHQTATSLNLPDSPPDSGSEPPFSPINEPEKLPPNQHRNSNSGGVRNSELNISIPSRQTGMENLKHFVDYTNHQQTTTQQQTSTTLPPSTSASSHIKLETNLNNIAPHQLHQSVI